MTSAAQRLQHTWESPIPLLSFLTTVDHKKIAYRYLVTALVFMTWAGLDSIIMRTQLAVPNNDLISPSQYDRSFTMHGTGMIFLVVTPMIVGGFGNYLVPLMIGARDMAFPRLNAFAFWVYLAAGVFIYSSILVNAGPNGGWFAYVPLTENPFTPGMNLDYWSLGLIFLGVSTVAGAINFIVTIFTMRAPGMTLNRMPLFIWACWRRPSR